MARAFTVEAELRRIAEEHGGILRAQNVVEEAGQPASPLHEYFTWDNTAAAHHWRLQQARGLIRLLLDVRPVQQRTIQARLFWSLGPDRSTPGGGYRLLQQVLEVRTLREQLLTDALSELEHLQLKYQSLTELANVFRAIEAVSQPTEPSSPTTDHRKQDHRKRKPGKSKSPTDRPSRPKHRLEIGT
jgi:hypothetical protein